MKKILIPIDFTFNSYDAIDYAVNFFKDERCEFYFLNTYSFDIDGFNALSVLQTDDDRFEQPKHDSEMSLGLAIKKYTYANENKKHSFNAISEHNNLIDGIKEIIKNLTIDLVVIARKKSGSIDPKGYSKNTKRIIEQIRECPVMIIPPTAKLQKNPEFILVSSFEIELPKSELENWYELVKIANGKVKLATLSPKAQMTQIQKEHQNHILSEIEMYLGVPITVEYFDNAGEFRRFAQSHSENIICLIDRKPDFWRKCGLTQSQITNLGPLKNTSLIALHH